MSAVLEPTGQTDGVPPYCAWCGGARADGDHAACERRLATVDPPRHCPVCARRMVVQVDPVGWTARCSRHGESAGANGFG
ncbi:biotin synthase auxiliary protein BsaP [Actinomycetospora aeridis]|uniref:Biotin synthase auxiliary protein n=1 Tax=Actinomycetospora aeridis TaxID=3129231 RepID=A0ABU8NFY9_9PSEU